MLVIYEQNGPIATLTLNRPERHNSLTPEFLREILAALRAVDDTVRVLVLQANGRSFSTGGDAKEFVEHAADIEAYACEIVGLLNEVILALLDLPVPVVTAVHGILTGGSLGLVLGSDIVLVAPQASFTPYYSVVGPSPDGGWATLLSLLIGEKRAAEVLFLNETIGAETAVAWGLANHVVPAAQIQATAQAIAQDIAAKYPGSIRRTRRLLHWNRDEIAARLAAEHTQFVQEMVHGAGLTGFQQFMQKRQETQTSKK
ncbi:MAG: enoyl-CoA hydratase/isomerase family protein [Chloroflexota bacterium]